MIPTPTYQYLQNQLDEAWINSNEKISAENTKTKHRKWYTPPIYPANVNREQSSLSPECMQVLQQLPLPAWYVKVGNY